MFRLSSEFALPNWLVESSAPPYLTSLRFDSLGGGEAFWLKFMAISLVALSLCLCFCFWLDFLEHFTHLPFTFNWKFSHIAALTQLVAHWPAHRLLAHHLPASLNSPPPTARKFRIWFYCYDFNCFRNVNTREISRAGHVELLVNIISRFYCTSPGRFGI